MTSNELDARISKAKDRCALDGKVRYIYECDRGDGREVFTSVDRDWHASDEGIAFDGELLAIVCGDLVERFR